MASSCIEKRPHSCGSGDMIAKKFGRLTVLSELKERNKDRRVMFSVICDCGTIKAVSGKQLRSGKTKSCGCLPSELTAKRNSTNKSKMVDGVKTKSHPLYKVYQGMLTRCYNQKHMHFYRYGGRGIQVCGWWRHSFRNFVEDMGPRPEGKTLDRVDNNLGYCKENCRWATMKEQCLNRAPNSGWRRKKLDKPVP